jgi:hypothetical protein
MHKGIAHDLGPESDKVAQGMLSFVQLSRAAPRATIITILILYPLPWHRHRTELGQPRYRRWRYRVERNGLRSRIQRCHGRGSGSCRTEIEHGIGLAQVMKEDCRDCMYTEAKAMLYRNDTLK